MAFPFATASALALSLSAPAQLGCSGRDGSSVAAKNPVEIGVVASVTGDLEAYGTELLDGATLAFDEINRAGGVLGGRPLKLYVQDDGTKTDGTKAAYATLLTKGVPVILGTNYSGGVAAIAEQIRTGRTLTITPSATSPDITTLADDGFLYRTAVSDTVQGVVLAQLVADAGRKGICVVHRDDTWGRALSDIAITNLSRSAPATRIVKAPYSPDLSDFSAVMQPCDELLGTPDAGVMFLTYVQDGALILDSAQKRGWSPLQHRFFFGDGIYDAALLSKVPNAAFLEGAVGTSASGPDPATPIGARAKAFAAKYVARFGREPSPFSANSYDAAYVAAAAIEIAKSATDREAVAKAIGRVSSGVSAEAGDWPAILRAIAEKGELDYEGASGNVDFDPATGDILPPSFIAVWSVAGGVLGNVRIVTVEKP